MRGRRRWLSLTNRDAWLLSRFDGCPEGASFGYRGAHDGQHRVDEVVEVEPVTPTPPAAHHETQPWVPESGLPTSAHALPPGSLTSREEERRLTGDEDLVARGSQSSIRLSGDTDRRSNSRVSITATSHSPGALRTSRKCR